MLGKVRTMTTWDSALFQNRRKSHTRGTRAMIGYSGILACTAVMEGWRSIQEKKKD